MRSGVVILGLTAAAVIVLASTDCAEPTEILLDVRTDACAYVKNTGIAVGGWSEIDSAPIKTITPAGPQCSQVPNDRVGTLTVYPTGAKDGEVAIRVVVGIDKPVEQCEPTYEGCIVARRKLHFSAGASRRVIVVMSLACKSRDCGDDSECNRDGLCIDPASFHDDGKVDPSDAGHLAPSVDAGDPCQTCTGPGMTCDAGTCTVDCAAASCSGKNACPDGMNGCVLDCSAAGVCNRAQCAAPGSCRIECGTSPGSCQNVACNSASCTVHCSGASACAGVALAGGTASLKCDPSDPTCGGGAVHCDAGRCALACDPTTDGGCPAPRACDNPGSCTSDPSGLW